MNELRRERKRDVITTLSHRAVAFTATIYIYYVNDPCVLMAIY